MSRWSAASPPRCSCRRRARRPRPGSADRDPAGDTRLGPERRVPFRNFAWLCALREARMAVNAARARKHQPLNGARPLHPIDPDGPSLKETLEASGRPDDDPVAKTLGRDRLRRILARVRPSPSSSAAPWCCPPATAPAANPPPPRSGERAVNNALQRARKKLADPPSPSADVARKPAIGARAGSSPCRSDRPSPPPPHPCWRTHARAVACRAHSAPDPAHLPPRSAHLNTLAALLPTAYSAGAQRRHEPVQRDDHNGAHDVLDLPRARDAQHRYHAARIPPAWPRQPACRVARALQVRARPAQRLGLDHKRHPGGSPDDMVEIPAARPVDGMSNLPSVADQPASTFRTSASDSRRPGYGRPAEQRGGLPQPARPPAPGARATGRARRRQPRARPPLARPPQRAT